MTTFVSNGRVNRRTNNPGVSRAKGAPVEQSVTAKSLATARAGAAFALHFGGPMRPERICAGCGAELVGSRRGGRRYCGPQCYPSRRSRYAPDPEETTAPPGTHAELIELLWAAARKGTVSAVQLLLREVEKDGPERASRSVIEELARRRGLKETDERSRADSDRVPRLDRQARPSCGAFRSEHPSGRALLGRYAGRRLTRPGTGPSPPTAQPEPSGAHWRSGMPCARLALRLLRAAHRRGRNDRRQGRRDRRRHRCEGRRQGLSSEVLVSHTVEDLVAGSGLVFEDADEHELKGVPERWHLYRVRD